MSMFIHLDTWKVLGKMIHMCSYTTMHTVTHTQVPSSIDCNQNPFSIAPPEGTEGQMRNLHHVFQYSKYSWPPPALRPTVAPLTPPSLALREGQWHRQRTSRIAHTAGHGACYASVPDTRCIPSPSLQEVRFSRGTLETPPQDLHVGLRRNGRQIRKNLEFPYWRNNGAHSVLQHARVHLGALSWLNDCGTGAGHSGSLSAKVYQKRHDRACDCARWSAGIQECRAPSGCAAGILLADAITCGRGATGSISSTAWVLLSSWSVPERFVCARERTQLM